MAADQRVIAALDEQRGAWFEPQWQRPANVRCLVSTRNGGVSSAPYTSFNLARHVGDDPRNVIANRMVLRQALPSEPRWLQQVHGTQVIDLDVPVAVQEHPSAESGESVPRGDAAVTRVPGTVAAILTADCLPVLLAADTGVVAAAHAGWRGLCDGVLEATVAAMVAIPQRVHAYLGPAISLPAYEVGDEVRAAFVAHDAAAAAAFVPNSRGRWQCDLYELARQRLRAVGVHAISGGAFCTFRDERRFYSYRRDGATGRFASLIWIGGA